MVRAKFYVAEVTAFATGQGSVRLSPVTRGEENREWSAATPSGEIKMTITNTSAWEWFRDRLGTELAISFEEFAQPEASTT